jgi:hypothetical protein
MASLSAPATTEQMIQEQLKERDRMMTQSIQALAMDRLRSSVRSLSRETGFQSRPVVGSFAYAPLYIPEYQRWSMGQQRVVGFAPPQMPNIRGALQPGLMSEANKAVSQGRSGVERFASAGVFRQSWNSIGTEVSPWKKWAQDWLTWNDKQKELPV